MAIDDFTYQELISMTLSLFSELTSIYFSWVDDENDTIIISSNQELLEALRVLSYSKMCLRFEVLDNCSEHGSKDFSLGDLERLCLQMGYEKDKIRFMNRWDRVKAINSAAACAANLSGAARHGRECLVDDDRCSADSSVPDSGVVQERISDSLATTSSPTNFELSSEVPQHLIEGVVGTESAISSSACTAKTLTCDGHLRSSGSHASLLNCDISLDSSSEHAEFFAPSAPPAPLSCQLVRDVTMPDGSEVAPHCYFIKTWRVLNDGLRDWPEGCHLVSAGGDPLVGPKMQGAGSALREPVPAVAAGAEVEMTVQLRAPSSTGRHVGYFRLQDPAGCFFGQRLWADMRVTHADMSVSCFFLHDEETEENNDEETADMLQEDSCSAHAWRSQAQPPLQSNLPPLSLFPAEQRGEAAEAAIWGQELALLAAMGFNDATLLLPLLRSHIGAPAECGPDKEGSDAGLQAVVLTLLAAQEFV